MPVSISTSKVERKMENISERIEDAAEDTASNLANDAADTAEAAAPRLSGRLQGYIRSEKTGKHSARVISRNPSVYNHEGFSLPLWLHAKSQVINTPYAGTRAGYYGKVSSPQDHLSSGVAKYMEVAYFEILRRVDQEFDQQFNKQF